MKNEIKANFKLLENNSKKSFSGDLPKDVIKNFLIDANFLSFHIKKLCPDFIIIMGDEKLIRKYDNVVRLALWNCKGK